MTARYEHIGDWDVWTMPPHREPNIPTEAELHGRSGPSLDEIEWESAYKLIIPELGIDTGLLFSRKRRLTPVSYRTQSRQYTIPYGTDKLAEHLLVTVTRHYGKRDILVSVMAQRTHTG